MSSLTLITATTAAVNSQPFSAIGKNNIGMVAADLGATETIIVQVWAAAASTPKWINYTIDGVQQEFSQASPVVELTADTLSYRLVKPITVAAVGVSINSDVKIGGL